MIRAHLSLLALAFALAHTPGNESKAEWAVLKARDKGVSERAEAARSILKHASADDECGKVVPLLIDFSLKATTPPQLRDRIAGSIATCTSESTAKALAQKVGAGQPYEREFILHAARNVHSPDLDKVIVSKGLTDDDVLLCRLALDILVQHKYAPAVPALESIFKSTKDPELVHPAIAGISTILKGTPDWAAWETKLVELARSDFGEQRRSALMELSTSKDATLIDVFVAALSDPDWSTRSIALAWLEKADSKRAVTAIVEQMVHEPAGSRMNSECCHALERISGGLNFGDRAADWATWWHNNEATFAFAHSSAPSTPDPRPSRPVSDTSVKAAEFYGIRVESERVCFVIDISGSMNEPIKQPEEGVTSRIDVARRELGRIIDELPPGSLFNIISFNVDVDPWLDRVGDSLPGTNARGASAKHGPSTGDDRNREKEKEKEPALDEAARQKEAELAAKRDAVLRTKARAYVDKLKASGGTNINDALEMAFADHDVDTIFFLTDGKPSVGRRIDPDEIREAVRGWNATRHVKLNTIAIGEENPLVMQLAQDNGGQYRFFP
jgi:hypothetical protein